MPCTLETNKNKFKEYDDELEEPKDMEANACAAAKTSMESKENNTYLCIDTKLSIAVGHWNKSRMTCHQEGENDDILHMLVVPVANIRMPPWPPSFTIMGRQGCDTTLKMTFSRG
jgi:hypothetical protein